MALITLINKRGVAFLLLVTLVTSFTIFYSCSDKDDEKRKDDDITIPEEVKIVDTMNIHVPTAGTLQDILIKEGIIVCNSPNQDPFTPRDVKIIITNCTITGKLNEIDFINFDSGFCKNLNLKDVQTESVSYLSTIQSVILPANLKRISKNAFKRSSISSIVIPESVTSIEDYAFLECINLKSIKLPNNITSIGSGAFALCNSFTSVSIPKSVMTLGRGAFGSCSELKELIIEDGENAIQMDNNYYEEDEPQIEKLYIGRRCAHTFSSRRLTTITLGRYAVNLAFESFNSNTLKNFEVDKENSNYTAIEGVLFNKEKSLLKYPSGRDAIQYSIPSGTTKIDNGAFSFNTSLKTIIIPSDTKIMASTAFYQCHKLEEFIVSNENPYFSSENGVLYNKGKTDIIAYPTIGNEKYLIPNTVSRISPAAFRGCKSISQITLPNLDYIFIHEKAFNECNNLNEIHCLSLIPPELYRSNGTQYVFDRTTFSTCKLYVPKGTLETYFSSIGWKDFLIITEE